MRNFQSLFLSVVSIITIMLTTVCNGGSRLVNDNVVGYNSSWKSNNEKISIFVSDPFRQIIEYKFDFRYSSTITYNDTLREFPNTKYKVDKNGQFIFGPNDEDKLDHVDLTKYEKIYENIDVIENDIGDIDSYCTKRLISITYLNPILTRSAVFFGRYHLVPDKKIFYGFSSWFTDNNIVAGEVNQFTFYSNVFSLTDDLSEWFDLCFSSSKLNTGKPVKKDMFAYVEYDGNTTISQSFEMGHMYFSMPYYDVLNEDVFELYTHDNIPYRLGSQLCFSDCGYYFGVNEKPVKFICSGENRKVTKNRLKFCN